MKNKGHVTSYCPNVTAINPGAARGRHIQHTVRLKGTGDWLAIHTRGGCGHYRFPTGEFKSQAGDITLYRPGTFQDYEIDATVARWDLLWAHFLPRMDWLPWLNWPELSPGLLHLRLGERDLRRRLSRRWRQMIGLYTGAQGKREVFALNALEEILLWCESVNPLRGSSALDPRVAKAMEYLGARLSEPFSEEKMARAAGLSSSRLRHLFQEQTKCSPRRFQELLRLRKARDFLSLSRLNVGEIARELGFANPFYFTLRFKRETGESPRDYRSRTTGVQERRD